MNKFILLLMLMAVLAGIWSIYWFTKAYFTDSPSAVGCATVSPPPLTPTDSLAIRGETLFKNNCSACHMTHRRLIGPSLNGITTKYVNDKEWLYEWVRNSQKLIQSGDPKAIALFEQYDEIPMVAFPKLTDKDIEAILAFVDYETNIRELPVY